MYKKYKKNYREYILIITLIGVFILTLFVLTNSVIKPFPNNIIANGNNDSKIEANIISVSAINQSVDLNNLSTKVNIIKLSKDEKQIIINIDIANNSKKNSIDLGWFKFSISDDKNDIYKADIYIGNDYIMYGAINPLETKQVTLKIDNINDIKVNKLIIKYDDIRTNKFEKELELTKHLN
jgi:hypothetical protein